MNFDRIAGIECIESPRSDTVDESQLTQQIISANESAYSDLKAETFLLERDNLMNNYRDVESFDFSTLQAGKLFA